jgi:23S rRNA (uridine2552-2'-O)-methyltransferase
MKLSDLKRDRYHRLAKKNKYRSRAAFKLIQMNSCYHILNSGITVVDIGSAPGGWIQVAVEEISPGRIIGIDVKKLEPINGATIIQGDIRDSSAMHKIIEALNGKADAVLSDIGVEIGEDYDLAHQKQIELTRRAIDLAKQILRKNGDMIFKVYNGHLLNPLISDISNDFDRVILTKPDASREQSNELYIICFKFKSRIV